MFCPECGKSIPDHSKFCIGCGTSLSHATPINAGVQDPLDRQATEISREDEAGSFAVGSLFANRYEVLAEGLKGGMGCVYKCCDTKLHNKVVALKVIHPRLLNSPQALSRFRQEVAISQELQHPNIVKVFNLEEWDGKEYFTMEWVEGKTLRQVIEARRKNKQGFSLREATHILSQLCAALHSAHQHTIHRDIKPENVLLVGDGAAMQVKLTDFGIAKMLTPSQFTSTSLQMGTPYYMAPEQKVDSANVDKRADIYALGVVLFELLTMENTIGPDLPSEINPSLPKAIDQIYRKAVATKPQERYGDALELSGALSAVERENSEEAVAERRKEAERKEWEARQREEERQQEKKKQQDEQRRREEAARREAEERKQAEGRPATPRPAADTGRPHQGRKQGSNGLIIGAVALIVVAVIAFAVLSGRKQEVSAPVPAPTVTPPVAAAPVAPPPVAKPQPVLTASKPVDAGMKMVFVKGGCFQMGDTFGDGYDNEKPVHEVCVGDFYMGKYEVTQGEWQKVMGSNPAYFKKDDRYPVEQVSWNDAQDFIRRLNQQTGNNYRLPTEAEWEYAARSGGRQEKYAGGNSVDAVVWYDSNSGGSTHPVGHKQANGLNLFDMSGNVWEWTGDWYGGFSGSRQQDPAGPSSGSHRVFRGGSWRNDPKFVRASYRNSRDPGFRSGGLGFRLVSPVR